jgi:sugar phosphate isomerase/epimerase
MPREPKFSVSEITTFHQTFEEDVANYAEGGAEGIGIWEFKLPEGKDADSIARLRDAGLQATTCIPSTFSIYPIPLEGGAATPQGRTEEVCTSIRRFAQFEPQVVLCLTGNPGDGVDRDEARHAIVGGLRKAARVAAEYGLTLGVEPLHRHVYRAWSVISTIPETIDLLDEIGEPNAKLLYDVYHLWDTDNVLEDTVAYGDRIMPSVHVCDWHEPPRNDFDRSLPGDGSIDLPAMLGALEAGGVVGWFDLEIFSDDGSFSDVDLEDSLWKQDPLDVVRRGKAGFERAWAARSPPERSAAR